MTRRHISDRTGPHEPRSLFAGADEPTVGPLTEDEARDLATKITQFVKAPESLVTINSAQTSWTELNRSQVSNASDTRYTNVDIVVTFGPRSASISTNHLDDDSLRAAVARAEALAREEHVGEQVEDEPIDSPAPMNPALWHDSTIEAMGLANRFEAVRQAMESIDAAGLTSSGYVGVTARSAAVLTNAGHFEYGRISTGECSISARTPEGSGSGWAAWKGENWSLADPQALASHAADVAHHSRFPIAIEPGRYMVVLSPVAVAELLGAIMYFGFDGRAAEEGRSPFSRENGTTALGTKIFGEHVTLTADPMDPDGGFLPFVCQGRYLEQYRPVTWVKDGVLENLAYDGAYARLQHKPRLLNSGALRMRGDDVSLQNMIASVDHGVYITRFSGVTEYLRSPVTLTGTTRDGTFLIEHGKITRALRNMRFQASPFMFLRDVSVLGKSERTPVSGPPIVVPGMVINEFAFIAITEAV